LNFSHKRKPRRFFEKPAGFWTFIHQKPKKIAKNLRVFLFLFTRRIIIISFANEIEEVIGSTA
jgi:hypothetical protein